MAVDLHRHHQGGAIDRIEPVTSREPARPVKISARLRCQPLAAATPTQQRAAIATRLQQGGLQVASSLDRESGQPSLSANRLRAACPAMPIAIAIAIRFLFRPRARRRDPLGHQDLIAAYPLCGHGTRRNKSDRVRPGRSCHNRRYNEQPGNHGNSRRNKANSNPRISLCHTLPCAQACSPGSAVGRHLGPREAADRHDQHKPTQPAPGQ
jgi:hypothetical protein